MLPRRGTLPTIRAYKHRVEGCFDASLVAGEYKLLRPTDTFARLRGLRVLATGNFRRGFLTQGPVKKARGEGGPFHKGLDNWSSPSSNGTWNSYRALSFLGRGQQGEARAQGCATAALLM
jgi:hypothetical protein